MEQKITVEVDDFATQIGGHTIGATLIGVPVGSGLYV
jgi:hypothetical protein